MRNPFREPCAALPRSGKSQHFESDNSSRILLSSAGVLERRSGENCCTACQASGFIFLQWPHHGAKNFTKTVLPLTAASQFSLVSSLALAKAKRSSATFISASKKSLKATGLVQNLLRIAEMLSTQQTTPLVKAPSSGEYHSGMGRRRAHFSPPDLPVLNKRPAFRK